MLCLLRMDNHAVVDQIVQSLSFEVEAVPKSKTVELTNSSKNTPLNVKIRVRKKENLTMRRGVISIPKFVDPETIPQKIRLVNSDQTIMSFDVFMEAEFEKKPLRKPRKHIFDMLKPGICLGATDDDDYPYLPSSSYSANVSEDNANSRSDGVLKHNFTLSKNTYEEYGDPTKGKTFLGKCKPGGCLDPPFGEDKYSYKPVIQVPLENEENTLKKENVQDSEDKKGRRSSVFDSNIFKKKRKTSDQSTGTKGSGSIKGNQSNSILNLYQAESTVNSLSTTHSNSIITYPPALASSELPMSDEKNRSRVSSEDRSRKSFNEYTDTYFIPPKGINQKKDKNKDIKSDADDYNSKIKEFDKNNKKIKPIDTSKLPMPIPIPVPIPIKSETVKHQTSAPDVEKYNVGNIGSKVEDSRVLLEPENETYIKIPSGVNLTDQEVGKEDSSKVNLTTMEAKYVTLDDFDKIKQDTLSDTDSKHMNLSQVSIISQHLSKQEEKIPMDKTKLIKGQSIEGIHQQPYKRKEEESPQRNGSIKGALTKDSPRYSLKQEGKGLPTINDTIAEAPTKDSHRHSFKQQKEGSPNRNATIEESHTKDSPRHSLKQEKEGSPNRNASIEEPHTNDSPHHSFKQEKEGSPNRNATIGGPNTKDSARHSLKQEKEGSPNRNATIGVPYTKESPLYSLKEKKEGTPNRNATIEEPHTNDSPRHSFKQEKEGSPNRNATIEESHTKDSPRHSLKQEKEGSPNRNASIEEPHTNDSPHHSFKQEKEGSPNRNATIGGPNTKDSARHSLKQEKEGSPNRNATIGVPYTKESPLYSLKEKKEGTPNRNATIEEPHTNDSPRHSFKQEKEGSPNRNATNEGPYTKDIPRHSFRQEKEGSPNRNATIEEPHTNDRPRHSFKQEKEGSPNRNATIGGPNTKDSPRHSLKQEKEGSPNRNATIEVSYTKESPRHSLKQEKEVSPNRNATIEGSYAKDNPRHSFKQEKDGSPNRNATIEGPYTKDSPRHSLKQEKDGLPNKNATIEGPYTKDSPRHSLKKEKDGLPNKNATIEGPYTKDSPRQSFKQEKEGSPNRNATIEGPYAIDSPRHSFKQEKDGPHSRNATIEGPYTKDNSENTFKQELRKHEIPDVIMPPEEDYVQIMDTAEKPTGSFLNESDLNQKDNPEEKLDEDEEAIAHNTENIIDFEYSERKLRQKSPSFSEPGIFERKEADLDSSNIYQNNNEIIPSYIDMNIDTNNKVSGNGNMNLQNDTGKNNNAGDDLLSADRNSQIYRPIKDSSEIIKQQLQPLKDTEYIESSTGEMIDNSYTTALATRDTLFKKLGSVDSEINLFDEHSINIENKEQYDLDEIQWKAALRTGGAEVVDDHDSSASPSIIKSTKNKGEISPNKRVVIPMYNSGNTETLTKSGDTPDESRLNSNPLDKQLSNSRSYVGSASASSSIPSTSTLKSVLKKDTIAVDLAFQSYLNEKNERVLKTFDMAIEPKRYSNDSITLVKSQVRLSANEIRIPIDSENDMFIHIKKASVNQHVHISESELETVAKRDLKSADTRYPQDIINREFLHDNLLDIYEQELVPLQMIIKTLKDEIDVLASQQMMFKEKVFSPKKIKPPRVVHSNRRCGCLKKL